MCIRVSIFFGYISPQNNLVSKGKYQQMENRNLPKQVATMAHQNQGFCQTTRNKAAPSSSNVSALEVCSLPIGCKISSALLSSLLASRDTLTPKAKEVKGKGDKFC